MVTVHRPLSNLLHARERAYSHAADFLSAKNDVGTRIRLGCWQPIHTQRVAGSQTFWSIQVLTWVDWGSTWAETDNSGGEADQSYQYDLETACDLDMTVWLSHSIRGHKPALPHKFWKRNAGDCLTLHGGAACTLTWTAYNSYVSCQWCHTMIYLGI